MTCLEKGHSSMEYEKLDLKTFKYTEHNSQDMEIDFENIFYNNTQSHYDYYTEQQFFNIQTVSTILFADDTN